MQEFNYICKKIASTINLNKVEVIVIFMRVYMCVCVCVCVCVLWGSTQPLVESKTLATNTVAKGYTSVGRSGSLKRWQKK